MFSIPVVENNKSTCGAETHRIVELRYFIRFIAGFATTVTSNSLIKENVSNTKKAIKKNNSSTKLKRIIKL